MTREEREIMGNLRVQRRQPSRSESGASLVEFALIVPVFLMILFGGITAGLALNEKQQITHATREGARYAATVPADQEFADTSKKWQEHVRDLIIERSAGTLDDADEICVSLVQGSPGTVVSPAADYSTTGSPCIANQSFPLGSIGDGMRVQVTASKDARIDLVLFGSYPVSMDVEATALSEPSS